MSLNITLLKSDVLQAEILHSQRIFLLHALYRYDVSKSGVQLLANYQHDIISFCFSYYDRQA